MRWTTRASNFVQDLIRTTIYELRRNRRVLVTPESLQSADQPVFIIGVHRSGTTLVRLIIDSHTSYACPPESFFLLPLQHLLADGKAMEGLAAMGFPREHVVQQLRESVSHFFEVYAASRGKPRWADKTPPYIDCLDFIEELYGPECRYVFVYRHGLDSACSIAQIPSINDIEPYLEICGGNRYVAAARHWAVQCRKMLDFQRAHSSRCFALHYEQLSTDPEVNCRSLFEFLDQPWESKVLDFYKHPHDRWLGLEDGRALRSRGFEPKIGAYRDLPPETIERMAEQAGDVLAELGYDRP